MKTLIESIHRVWVEEEPKKEGGGSSGWVPQWAEWPADWISSEAAALRTGIYRPDGDGRRCPFPDAT